MKNLTTMDKFLIQRFNLESDVRKSTPYDKFKLYRNFNEYIEALKFYQSQNDLTPLEKIYFDLECDPRTYFMYRISNTHFDTYFLSINFILTNPVLISEGVFDNLYRERELLIEITDHIIHLFKTLDEEFVIGEVIVSPKMFYNKLLINKFIDNLLPETKFTLEDIKDPVIFEKYETYVKLFDLEIARLKEFMISIKSDFQFSNKMGLSMYPPQLYQFAFEYNTGLKLNCSFDKIKSWAERHLNKLMEETNKLCDKLLNSEKLTLSLREKMKLINSDPSQKWSSSQEMAQAYRDCVEKYRNIYIDERGFKEFTRPGIHVFDNPLLAGGYYYQNRFYLNVCDWAENSKYEVENLTLHETIPGHHLQITISNNSPHSNLLSNLFQAPSNGFIEGWGLFSEHLGNQNHDPWTYYGYLQANILRTFRIIAEIMLHIEGCDPEQVIEYSKNYLTMGDKSIESEIYRYVVLPGQAMSYKIGLEVFKTIIQKKFSLDVNNLDILQKPELLEWYKEILWKCERPLKLFLEENDCDFNFD